MNETMETSEAARSWSSKRPLTHLIDSTDRQDEMNATRTCSVSGCDTEIFARGWCSAHYQRWRNHGDPTVLLRQKGDHCSVDGCDRPYEGSGYCKLHRGRWKKHGDPLVTAVARPWEGVTGVDSPSWVGEDVSYSGLHQRLYRIRGKASSYQCSCGAPASSWAYDHTDPNERVDPKHGGPYSVDLAHYAPMCTPCHKRFDLGRLM